MRHFAAAEPQCHLDLVAFLEKPLHRAHFHVVIVIVDHRTEFYLLDLDDLLFLARLGRFLLRLIFIFAEIENLTDRRDRIRRDLNQIEPGLLRHGQSCLYFGDALVGAVFVDELDLAYADLLVDARTLLGGGLRQSDWATNGTYLLWSLLRAAWTRTTERRLIGDGHRQLPKIGSFCVQVNDNAVACMTKPWANTGPTLGRYWANPWALALWSVIAKRERTPWR